MEGDYRNFPSRSFCLTLPEHFVEETFSAVIRKISESEKIYGKEVGRGEHRKFPSIIFCLKMPKSFVGESFSLSLFSGIEKINASEGFVTIFRRIVFVSQYRNISKKNEEPFCAVFQKISGSENFYG